MRPNEKIDQLQDALIKVIDWLEFIAKHTTDGPTAKDYLARAKDLRRTLDS